MSLSQSVGQFLFGPLFGGVIVAVAGIDWAFGVDAISFLASDQNANSILDAAGNPLTLSTRVTFTVSSSKVSPLRRRRDQ